MLYSELSPSELPANIYGSRSLGKRYRPRFTEKLVLAVTDLRALLQASTSQFPCFNYLRSFRLQVVSPTSCSLTY